MAQMYPEQLDPKTKSGAEWLLYDLFREQLDETFLVFHSIHWQAYHRRGNPLMVRPQLYGRNGSTLPSGPTQIEVHFLSVPGL